MAGRRRHRGWADPADPASWVAGASHDRSESNVSQSRLRPLSDIPIILESRGANPPSRGTVQRWITFGVRGRILQTTLVGGRHYFTLEALERFLERPSRARVDSFPAPAPKRAPSGPQGPEEAAYWAARLDAVCRKSAEERKSRNRGS